MYDELDFDLVCNISLQDQNFQCGVKNGLHLSHGKKLSASQQIFAFI